MEKESRIKNTVKNVVIGGGLQIFTLLLSFVGRTVFVRLLGNDYLSCDGLFSNILTLLSLSELGVGTAIVCSLYEPIAKEDRARIGKLLNLFASAYHGTAAFILIAGLCLIPFLGYIVTDVPDVEESISLLYVLFLANTACSYIGGYKKSYLMACQKNYIVLIVSQCVKVWQIFLQVVVLYVTHNYILYLLIAIICTISSNVICTYVVEKREPWLKKYAGYRLSAEEKEPIFRNIKAMIFYKLGSVVLNGTDNILISVCLKTAYIGLCSNYSLIIQSVMAVINQACNGMIASIGNYNVSRSGEDNYKIFDKLYFISFWVFGFCAVALAVLLTPFVGEVWLGEAYQLERDVVLMMSIVFYVNAINVIPGSFRTAMGLFHESKYCPATAAALNILLSVLLAKWFGLTGIFLATAVSKAITYNAVDMILIFKNGFRRSAKGYIGRLVYYNLVLVLCYLIVDAAANMVKQGGTTGFFLKCLCCLFCYNAVMAFFMSPNAVFRDICRSLCARGKHVR